jgi:hypothetical protein
MNDRLVPGGCQQALFQNITTTAQRKEEARLPTLGFGLLIYRIIKGCQTPLATKDFLPLKMCSVDHPKNEVAQRKVIIS